MLQTPKRVLLRAKATTKTTHVSLPSLPRSAPARRLPLLPALLLAFGAVGCGAEVPESDQLGAAQQGLTLPRPTIPGLEIGRDYPELGDLVGRSGRLDDDYVTCNQMQLTIARRAAWEPIFADLGAGAMVDEHVRRLTAVQGYACGDQLGSTAGQRAARSANAWLAAIDRQIATTYDLNGDEARDVRLDLVRSRMEEIRERCFGADTIDPRVLPLARFPMTPDRGFDVPQVTPADVWGDCPVGGPRDRDSDPVGGNDGSAATGPFDPRAMQQCLSEFASSSQCTNPAGNEPPPGETPPPPPPPQPPVTDNPSPNPAAQDMAWSDCGDGQECANQRVARGDEVRIRGGVRTESRQVTWEVRMRSGQVVGYRVLEIDRASGIAIEDHDVQLGAAIEGLIGGLGSIMDLVESSLGVIDRGRGLVEKVLERLPGRTPNRGPRPGGSLCQAVNPSSSSPVGYARPEPIGPLSGSPGVITGEDAFAYCLCNQGQTGRELANSMGFHCDNSAWLDRVECTRGDCPACGLVASDPNTPPECLAMLIDDNGESTLDQVQDACDSILTCPTGSLPFTRADAGGLRCSCRPQSTGGSGNGRTAECAVVNCRTMQQGNSAYQRCCGGGVPGQGPSPLPGPLPIPPRF